MSTLLDIVIGLNLSCKTTYRKTSQRPYSRATRAKEQANLFLSKLSGPALTKSNRLQRCFPCLLTLLCYKYLIVMDPLMDRTRRGNASAPRRTSPSARRYTAQGSTSDTTKDCCLPNACRSRRLLCYTFQRSIDRPAMSTIWLGAIVTGK